MKPMLESLISKSRVLFLCAASMLFIAAYLFASSALASLAFFTLCLLIVSQEVSRGDVARKSNLRIGLLMFVAVLVYQIMAVINSYFWEIPGARPDSVTFYDYGVAHARELKFVFGVDYVFYTHILGLLFRVFTPSYFLASQLSVLALVLSLVLFVRISALFKTAPLLRLIACFVFVFFPGTVAAGVVPLRESIELLFLISGVYCGVKLMIERRFVYFAALLISAVILGLTHKALLFYSIVLCLIFSLGWLVQTRHHNRKRVWIISSLGVTALTVLVGSLVYFNESGNALAYGLVDKNLWWSIWHYRYSVDNLGNPRSAYNIVFNYETNWQSAASLLKIYWHYLFYPLLPASWRPEDLYAVLESWFRLLTIAFVVWAFVTRRFERRLICLALFAVFLSLTFLWSIGTTNYGQAVRHHMLSNWVLLLLAVIGLSKRTVFSEKTASQ